MAAIGRRFTRFLSPFNIAHVPAIVFPIGQDGNGVPIAAQLVAAPWQEALLCHTGMAFQAATTHHLRPPTRSNLVRTGRRAVTTRISPWMDNRHFASTTDERSVGK